MIPLVVLAGCFAGPPSIQIASDATPPFGPACERPSRAGYEGDAASLPPPCLTYLGAETFEPTIGIHATGAIFFYPATNSTTGATGVARSLDAGATWEIVVPVIEASGEPANPNSLDPYLFLDPTTGRLFVDDLMPRCSTLAWSDDLGENWAWTVHGCTNFDHQTIFGGRTVTSTTQGYPNVVYHCAGNLVGAVGASTMATCEKSVDGGATFVPTGGPVYFPDPPYAGQLEAPGHCDGLVGHGVADHRGWLYVPKGHCGRPFLAISKDEGLTWQRVQVAARGIATGADGTKNHEASVDVDRDGNLYYSWVAEDHLPYLVVSVDEGATWTQPVRLSPGGVNRTWSAQLAAGAPGRVAIAYYGSIDAPRWKPGCAFVGECAAALGEDLVGRLRGASPPNYTWGGYVTLLYDALAPSPKAGSFLVNASNDPLIRGDCGPVSCQQAGDFTDIRIGPDGTAWATFVDGCHGECVLGQGRDEPGLAAVGHVRGAASLWDDQDPNGPFPDPRSR